MIFLWRTIDLPPGLNHIWWTSTDAGSIENTHFSLTHTDRLTRSHVSTYLIVSAFQPPPQERLHLQAKPRNILRIEWDWALPLSVCACAVMLVYTCVFTHSVCWPSFSCPPPPHTHSQQTLGSLFLLTVLLPSFPLFLKASKHVITQPQNFNNHFFKISCICDWLTQSAEAVIHGTIKISLFGGRRNSCVMLGRVPAGWAEVIIYCFPTPWNPPLWEEGLAERGAGWRGRESNLRWPESCHLPQSGLCNL